MLTSDARAGDAVAVLRAMALAMLVAWMPGAASGQALAVLHIKVTLTDAAGALVPLARHALLISDNPATASPRRVVTAPDGTADVRLRPGNYTVESDQPVALNGRAYQWTQTIDVAAGLDRVLELNAENADAIAGALPVSSSPSEPAPDDVSLLLPQWKDGVVALWTPTARGSGFIVDAGGLVMTNQRLIGNASTVAVQVTGSIKVAARLLVSDRVRDVAVLWIDPAIAASLRPVALDCAAPVPSLADAQTVAAMGVPLGGPTDVSLGEVRRGRQGAMVADLGLLPGSAGGPVFGGGRVVGLSSVVDDQDRRGGGDVRIVGLGDACAVVGSAQAAMQSSPQPVATRLPVEPLQPFPADAPPAATQRGAGNVASYRISSSDFDIAFITPPLIHQEQQKAQQAPRSGRPGGPETAQAPLGAPTDFGEWSEYFASHPAVLAIRVTPKFEEGFWMKVARGAAYTQGTALPPIKRFRPGFSRLRAYCGGVEVLPIHPFLLEQRVSETDAVREGLYIFDPNAFGPRCASVRLGLYSEKEPDKEDGRVVDPTLIARVWRDFTAYRTIAANPGARP